MEIVVMIVLSWALLLLIAIRELREENSVSGGPPKLHTQDRTLVPGDPVGLYKKDGRLGFPSRDLDDEVQIVGVLGSKEGPEMEVVTHGLIPADTEAGQAIVRKFAPGATLWLGDNGLRESIPITFGKIWRIGYVTESGFLVAIQDYGKQY